MVFHTTDLWCCAEMDAGRCTPQVGYTVLPDGCAAGGAHGSGAHHSEEDYVIFFPCRMPTSR